MDLNPFSSSVRPALGGRRGAVAAAHPLAAAAGQEALARGGTAVDAVIAAQAMLCVVSPDACGLGGDAFALVREPGGAVMAVNGAGPAAAQANHAASTGGAAVTVPGLVDAWMELHGRWGGVGLEAVLAPAVAAAEGGVRVDPTLAAARRAQGARLREGGAGDWALMRLEAGDRWEQPELAEALRAIGRSGRAALHNGRIGAGIVRAARGAGGALDASDLAQPAAAAADPVSVRIGEAVVHVQPPASQGVLLAMALDGFARGGWGAGDGLDHLAVELTQAAFSLRDEVRRGAALLDEMPAIDPARASRRGGPRAYLHTAGVAAADAEGRVASSLLSVFDDFGSGVFVPEGGFCLNNRAGGFTGGANAFAPGRRPVHTLAPALVEVGGRVVALSTPGADGQVQTLLQVILHWLVGGRPLSEAVAAPRWRSEDGKLLVEAGHPAAADLRARGHEVVELPPGDVRFGAVTLAAMWDGAPAALADWRRMTWAGVA